jgi:hypothetical protein
MRSAVKWFVYALAGAAGLFIGTMAVYLFHAVKFVGG